MSDNQVQGYFSLTSAGISVFAGIELILWREWLMIVPLFLILAGISLYDGVRRLRIEKKYKALRMTEDVEEKTAFHEATDKELEFYGVLLVSLGGLSLVAAFASFRILDVYFLALILLYSSVTSFYYCVLVHRIQKRRRLKSFLEEYKDR